jgi:DNA-damage-inducible protein D
VISRLVFGLAIKKAMESCRQSNNDPSYHFVGADKPITGGKGAIQIVKDYHLSRFA